MAEDFGVTVAIEDWQTFDDICKTLENNHFKRHGETQKFSTKGDAMVSPTATAALANAYEQTGNVDKAISTLKKAADMADSKAEDVNNSISPTFLLQAGKLLESQKKNDEIGRASCRERV